MMREPRKTDLVLEQVTLPVQVRLAGLWATLMFLYVYVDILGLYQPGVIDDILVGVVWEFDISQTFAVIALALMAVPILMIALSLVLRPRVSRTLNVVVAAVYIAVSIGQTIGESWLLYYALAAGLEVTLLALIIRCAWRWPTASSPAVAAGAHAERATAAVRR